MRMTNKLFSAAFACLMFVATAPPSFADDSEIFTNSAFLGGTVRPNVLFIIDTSGSMDTVVNSYDPARDYSSAAICTDLTRVYWSTTNSSTPPDCRTSNQWVSVTNNRCRAAFNGMTGSGWWNGRTQMLITGGNPTYWGNLVAGSDRKLECSSDGGVHGDLQGSSAPGGENKRARNGTGTLDANRWGNDFSSNQIDWRSKPRYSLYSANYINWFYGAGGSSPKTRLQIVREVAKNMVDSLDGVNLGIMRYDQRAEGGMVTYPVSELTTTSRAAMKLMLDGYVADGFTPLSETLFEAHQYLAGNRVVYGNTSTAGGVPSLSVAGSRTGGLITGTNYDSPMDFSCQNNFIVYLTDGLPTEDNGADAAIEALPNFAADGGGACPAQIENPDPSWPTDGRCLENLARYMHNHDLRSDVLGQQSVTTYVVGFGDDIATSADFLKTVAVAGGGQAYTQTDAAGLTGALEEIFNQVQEGADTTIVAPAVAVNAFNRTQNLNQLFVSVFAPSTKKHWPGNVKKYKFIDGEIVGVGNRPAVNPLTGFFYDYIKALNTPSGDPADGTRAKDGGSAARINAATRNLYTYLGSNTSLTAAANAVANGNAAITDVMVGAADATERTSIINFARGVDTNDVDEDADVTEQRKAMGDPMHARPAVVIYGGTVDSPIGTVFAPTNDGYLHAFDMQSGDELWAYIPQEFLARQGALFDNPPMTNRDYGLDGDVRIFKKDVDSDGIVEPADGDKVWIFFGTGRGGNSYYSLDVTSRTSPVFKWQKTSADTGLGKLGRTWSTPEISKVKIGTTITDVLIVGGGYDTNQEGYAYSTDSVGNAVYILDMATGAPLWSASNTGATLNDARMTHSIPSAIAVLDTNNDRLADRLYASDVGGRIWRFDIINGNSVASLVQGGVLASLGGASFGTPTLQQNRRFYNTPDPVLISSRGIAPFINIAIGSGYRGHPLETDTRDSFYSVRDFDVWNVRTTASYTVANTIIESQLVDITDTLGGVSATAKGWKIDMRRPSWRGEKVLAESVTVGGVVIFPTFTPLSPDPSQPCLARTANKVFAVLALNGNPAQRWNESSTGPLGVDDRAKEVDVGGIAPSLSIFADPIGSQSGESTNGDADGDGVPDITDTDDDNDGIPDASDSDPDGSAATDTDGDGQPNSTDPDDDNDGTPDGSDSDPRGIGGVDSDGDGTPNSTDSDDDNDGIADGADNDSDGDGIPNNEEEDDDDDEANCMLATAKIPCMPFGPVRSFWERR
jgi:type IV pilus assembly protein PilY1